MTINDVLKHDWHVNKIDVTVREPEHHRYIMRYVIGQNLTPGKSEKYLHTTVAGDVHGDDRLKTLFININNDGIPKEILLLPVHEMYPYDYGYSDDWHGYRFTCVVDKWNGVPGEDQVIDNEIVEWLKGDGDDNR